MDSLEAAVALLRSPDADVLPRLSVALRGPVPHAWAAALIGGTVRMAGGGSGGPAPTAAELARLAETVGPGTAWHGDAVLGGKRRQVLAVASTEPASAGSVLALVDAPGGASEVAQRLWEVAVARLKTLTSIGGADSARYLAASRLVSGKQAEALAALANGHAAALTAILGALRSRRLDDAAAREIATALASSALTDAHSAPVGGEQTAGEVFDSVGRRLRVLARHSGFNLELAPPGNTGRLLAAEVADAARTVVRGCVLAMLEHTGPTRIRVAWEAEEDLRINVRDDGAGSLSPKTLAEYRLREQLVALGGDFAVDVVPGWGTAVSARLPLALPPAPRPDSLSVLSPRELEVLAELARGRRNREIAARLHITEHTVKFHIANLLPKLGVRSRGEAAAVARDAHL